MSEVIPEKLAAAKEFWQARTRAGDAYVGRVGEDHRRQQQRMEQLLTQHFTPFDFYLDALDFGCGWGRMVPYFAQYCGHIWAVDIVPEMAQRAAQKATTVTPLALGPNGQINSPQVDLLWAGLVLQHIVNPDVLQATLHELRRVLKRGARVLILDNAVDHAPHVQSRNPDELASALLLQSWKVERVTINQREQDHWLLDGIA